MSATTNPVIGAMVHKDGKLQPVEGDDPSVQWTYREADQPDQLPEPSPG